MHLHWDHFDTFYGAVYHPEEARTNRRLPAWPGRTLRQIMRQRSWPPLIDLPIGADKTTCIAIAVFALALDAEPPRLRWCPRQVAMVVDGAAALDRVAERGRKLLRGLLHPAAHPVVREVTERLRLLSGNAQYPLRVLTPQSGMREGDRWDLTPHLPTVVATTIGDLGAHLLIDGQRAGRRIDSHPAHLLCNDVLLLLDEVHLSDPFADTLNQLEGLRCRFGNGSALSTRFHRVFLSEQRPAGEPTAGLFSP